MHRPGEGVTPLGGRSRPIDQDEIHVRWDAAWRIHPKERGARGGGDVGARGETSAEARVLGRLLANMVVGQQCTGRKHSSHGLDIAWRSLMLKSLHAA